jgi:hypothetical protein
VFQIRPTGIHFAKIVPNFFGIQDFVYINDDDAAVIEIALQLSLLKRMQSLHNRE